MAGSALLPLAWGSGWGADAGALGFGLTVTIAVWAASLPWQVAGWRPTVRSRGGRLRPHVWGVGRRAEAARAQAVPTVELAVVLDLLGTALSAGAGVPRAIDATGRALGGSEGRLLSSVGSALLLGAPWETAWAPAPARFAPVAAALRPAWVHGAPPREALRVAGLQISQDADARARAEAARLGVRLVLPLGLCLLPAFVLIGLVPVMVSLGSGLLG